MIHLIDQAMQMSVVLLVGFGVFMTICVVMDHIEDKENEQ